MSIQFKMHGDASVMCASEHVLVLIWHAEQIWHQRKYQLAAHKKALLFLVCSSAADWWETCKLWSRRGHSWLQPAVFPMAGKIYITEKHAHTALKKARHPSLSSNWVRSLLWLEEKHGSSSETNMFLTDTFIRQGGEKIPLTTVWTCSTMHMSIRLWWQHMGEVFRQAPMLGNIWCPSYVRSCLELKSIKYEKTKRSQSPGPCTNLLAGAAHK